MLERAAVEERCFQAQGVTGTCVFETLGETAFRVKKGDGYHKRTKLTKIFITGYDLHPGAPRSNPQHVGMRMLTLISRVKLTDYKFKEYILRGTGV